MLWLCSRMDWPWETVFSFNSKSKIWRSGRTSAPRHSERIPMLTYKSHTPSVKHSDLFGLKWWQCNTALQKHTLFKAHPAGCAFRPILSTCRASLATGDFLTEYEECCNDWKRIYITNASTSKIPFVLLENLIIYSSIVLCALSSQCTELRSLINR